MEDPLTKPHKTSWRVYFAVIFSSIGGFLFGYDQGVMSSILTMPHWTAYFNDPDSVWRGFITSIYLLGAFVGGLVSGPTSERIGRKRSIMAATIFFWFGTSMQTGASSVNLLMAGRFFQGIAIGMYSMNVTVYQSELSPPHLRGRAISFQQLVSWFLSGSVMVVPSKNKGNSPAENFLFITFLQHRQRRFLACSPWPAVGSQCALVFWMLDLAVLAPLAFLGPNPALETLAKLHADGDKQDPYVLKQYNEIIEQIKWEDQNAVHSYIEVFKSASIRKRVCLAAGMQMMQQWTGINAVLYYAPFIFKSAGMTDNLSTLLATGVNGIVCVIFTVPAVIFIDRWGRKNTLLAGGFGMGISMMIAGALLKVYPYVENGYNNTSAQYGAVSMMFIFSACFSTSWGPVGWIYPAEIFPNRARAKATSISTAMNYIMNFVIGEITPIMIDRIAYGTYLFFFATNMICITIVYLFYPETKNRTIEEMEILFDGEGAEAIERIARQGVSDTVEIQPGAEKSAADEKSAENIA